MAWFILARVLFIGTVAYSAALLRPVHPAWVPNLVFGLAIAALFVVFEIRLRHTPVTHMLGAMIGGALGLAVAKTVGGALFWANTDNSRVVFLHSVVLLALPYLGLVIGGRKGEWLEPARIVGLFRGAGLSRRYRILDTSVIIDGRVADICETGFLDGTLVIPQFVLKELQLVADSADSLKRNRGRRGLDILQKIQKMAGLEVMISDLDFPEVREVDLKLIELARALQGKIVTNDFNLNKVAQLRGVAVLNINELANSLKPVVLPGEIMKVFILKEGKEYNQGVAYLDDGTMVVVDNARQADRQDHRRRRHERAADDGRQDDLRPLRRSKRRGLAGAGPAERDEGRSRRAASRLRRPAAGAGRLARAVRRRRQRAQRSSGHRRDRGPQA